MSNLLENTEDRFSHVAAHLRSEPSVDRFLLLNIVEPLIGQGHLRRTIVVGCSC